MKDIYKFDIDFSSGSASFMQEKYVFLQKSKVFHSDKCRVIQHLSIAETCYDYNQCLLSGRRPCKVCNPTKSLARSDEEGSEVCGRDQTSPDVAKAIRKHRHSTVERAVVENNLNLSPTKKDDLCTLTSSSYAFFAAKGYRTFHIRNCCRIRGLQNLDGFSLYADACKAGYRPCKRCKPTDKYDVKVFLPIYTKQRDEYISEIVNLCSENSYECRTEDKMLYIKTNVSIWRLDMSQSPYRLAHINLTKSKDKADFHEQGRLFLSMTDAFYYIKRHDDGLHFIWKDTEYVPIENKNKKGGSDA